VRVTLSGHARKRMRERNVFWDDIEHVLASRGSEYSSSKKRTFRGRDAGGRRLEVVYTEARSGHFHVVTIKTLDR
jgi:hypothetical protein